MAELKDIQRLMDELVTRVEALEEKSEEIWVPVKDKWAYFVSNRGRVKTYTDFYPKITFDRSAGYYRVCLNRKKYYLHRLLAEAFIPNPENKPFIDHIDGDPLNNSLSNLRWCSRVENNRNKKKYRNNTSDYTGVYFNKWSGKWHAQISIDGRKKHLGYFHTKEEASAMYEEAAQKEFGEFFRSP